MKKLNKQLMNKHGGEIIPFKRLTMPYKLAIVWYMSCDGCAWENFVDFHFDFQKNEKQFKRRLIAAINKYDEMYGKEKFGVINVPVDVCKQHIMTISDIDNETLDTRFSSFKEYHKWYMSIGGIEKHTKKDAWPCILSDFDDEFLQDGWHRFHRYIDLKMPSIPCVCYV